MKTILISITFLIATLNIYAQHCPFDGGEIVIIKVIDTIKTTNFTLQEIDNPMADSCSYAEGLLTIAFKPLDSLYAQNEWVATYEERYAMGNLKSKGNYYALLNQATATCMIKRGNDYRYVKRQYVIHYKNETGDVKVLEFPRKMIFHMCTSAGSWARFKPIVIDAP